MDFIRWRNLILFRRGFEFVCRLYVYLIAHIKEKSTRNSMAGKREKKMLSWMITITNATNDVSIRYTQMSRIVLCCIMFVNGIQLKVCCPQVYQILCVLLTEDYQISVHAQVIKCTVLLLGLYLYCCSSIPLTSHHVSKWLSLSFGPRRLCPLLSTHTTPESIQYLF